MPERIFSSVCSYLTALMDKEKEEKCMVFEINERNNTVKGGRIMDTVKIVYNVQADAAKYVEQSTKGLALLMYPQIKNGTLSHGKVAELLGINKYDLIDWYDELGFPYFDISTEDVENDIQSIDKMVEQGGTL
jgi:hypothetical protein